KTGSHMIPLFLMKMVDSFDGKAARGRDLGFKLGAEEVGHYFGSSVLPEKLEEVLGEVSEEDIANSRSDVIIDHIFCTKCEGRLGELENRYAKTLTKSDDKVYLSTKEPMSALMLWASVLWRASVAETLGIKLSPKDESKLGSILNSYIDLEVPAVELKGIPALNQLSYKIIRSPGFSDEGKGFMFFNPHHRRPYCFLIGELAVFFYMKPSHLNSVSESFFGLEKYLEMAENNTHMNGESVLPLGLDIFNDINGHLAQFFASTWTNRLMGKLNTLHKKLGGQGDMPSALRQEIFNAIASNERELGRKYTNEEVGKVVSEIMVKYVQP
ncbi:MAG TPA: hypothetical protein VGD22_14535, partial [Sphingobacteriaceae bacterium]